jgi:hypothetical protein
MKKCCVILAAVGALAWSIGPAAAEPKPSAAPTSWQLELEFHDPERISVTHPGDDQPTTYWYLLYSVTNNTGREIGFYPSFDLVTDTLKLVEGGSGVHPAVYRVIQERYAKLYPFFVPPLEAYGTLQQGADYKRTSVVVFRDFDPEASSFTLFVGGLSGETTRLPNPKFDADSPESDNNVQFFVLRKTLAVHYELPGDPRSRILAKPTRVKREWVMR